MSPEPSVSAQQKSKKVFSRFLFEVTNQFTLDEFKKYTNFPDVMGSALAGKYSSVEERRLNHYVKHHFKKSLPIEKKWTQGAFVSLRLRDEFYQSETARRTFAKIFGIKKCQVNLAPINVVDLSDLSDDISITAEKNDSTSTSDVEFFGEISSDEGGDEEYVVEMIDLTENEVPCSSENNVIPPKMRKKYPRKEVNKDVTLPSGIAGYGATKKFVDQIQTIDPTEGFADEIFVSTYEPPIEDANSNESEGPPIVTTTNQSREMVPIRQAQKIVVLSDITLVQAKNAQVTKLAMLNSEEPSTSKNVNVMKCVTSTKGTPTTQVPVEETLSQNVKDLHPKPKIGPKSRVRKPEESVECALQELMPSSSLSEKPSQGTSQRSEFRKPKPKPVPKSRLKSVKDGATVSSYNSTQELLHDLECTASPLELQSFPPNADVPRSKPKIGPRSRVSSPQESVESAFMTEEKLLRQSEPPSTLVEKNSQDTPQHSEFLKPTPKVGPNSKRKAVKDRTADPPLISTQELLHDLMHTAPPLENLSEEPQLIAVVPQSKRKIGPRSRVVYETSSPEETLLSSPTGDEAQDEQQVLSPTASTIINKSTGTSTPIDKSTTPTRRQIHIGSRGEIYITQLPVEVIEQTQLPSYSPESSELINDFKRSFQSQQQRVINHLKKYISECEPAALSLKSFWYDFIKAEYENDSNAAETQLENDNDNVEDVQPSQAVVDTNDLANQLQQQLDNVNEEETLSEEPFESYSRDVKLIEVPPDEPMEVVQIKQEKLSEELYESYSSDVQFVEVPPDEPIEIGMDSTQDLMDKLEGDKNSDEHFKEPFTLPLQIMTEYSDAKSTVPGTSKRFMTSLPKVTAKKRTPYQPLDIAIEVVQKIPTSILPSHDFSQQPQTPPENYDIEECTMSDTQLQRYELLNNENTLFLSSQLENYEFNAGKPNDSNAPTIETILPMVTLKRLSIDAFNFQQNKRRRLTETIKRDLNWKIMEIRTLSLKAVMKNIFHMELQLRYNFDTFHIQDQQSIKRILHLTDNEWKNVRTILTALNGYTFDCSKRSVVTNNSNLMSRVMDCFVRSVPLFVRSNINLKDFMGHCLDVTEPKPLINKCTDSAIDSKILKKMEEFKGKFEGN